MSGKITARALGGLIALILVLGGCASAKEGPDVEGRTYTSTSVEGFEPAAARAITMSFSGDQVSLNAGCNTMFGAASWDGATLKVSELAITEMGCEPDLHAQDDVLAELLSSSPTVERDGTTLVVAGSAGGGDVRLVLEEVQDEPLEGTLWRLEGLEKDEAVSTVGDVAASLRIDNGEVSIEYGCNTGGGEVTVTDSTLNFGQLVMTLMACEDEETMAVEAQMAAVLAGEVAYEVDGARLRITSGSEGLHFRAG